MRNLSEQPAFFPDLEVQKSVPTFGEQIKVSGYLARQIGGNSYAVRPISTSETLRFLYEPTIIPSKRKLNETNPSQIESFDLDPDANPITIPSRFYKVLSSVDSIEDTLENLKITLGDDYLKYLPLAQKYFETVSSIGPQTPLSNLAYVIELQSLSGKYHLEGEDSYKKSLDLSGRLSEVRRGQDQDTIIRIRQNEGNPGNYDAIKLVLDWYAYMAISRKPEFHPVFPRLAVFNLTDGKLWQWKVNPVNNGKLEYPMIFRYVINAINFASLSLNAGYLDEEKDPSTINPNFRRDHAKKIYVRKNKKPEEVFTAQEALKNAVDLLNKTKQNIDEGQMPYRFIEIKI